MKYLPFSQTKSGSNDLLCAHGRAGQAQHFFFWRRANFVGTKFGGDGKIGIGKRGRAKIPSPQPPSFLPARAFGFCRAKRGNQSGFCSKKVRTSFSNCDQSILVKFPVRRAQRGGISREFFSK